MPVASVSPCLGNIRRWLIPASSRFQESHTDLREWYHHCLDFTALKQRLVLDPPDPDDDYPSMAESPLGSGPGASGLPSFSGVGIRSRVSSEPNLRQDHPLNGCRAATMPLGREEHSEGTYLTFPDRATRAFLFHLSQELERVWEFYRDESARCAATLSRLQDVYALRRHLLHKRIGGMPISKGTPGPGDDEGRVMDGDSSLLDTEFQTSVVRADGQVGLDALKELLLGSSVVASDASRPRSRSRRSAAASPPETPSRMEDSGVVSGGATGMGTGGGSSGSAAGSSGGSGLEEEIGSLRVTEDPYERARIKEMIVELYDTCHRLLSFKMLNYDACERLVELHCRRAEADVIAGRNLSSSHWDSGAAAVAGDAGELNGGAVAGSLASSAASLLGREKSMKLWLLNQPVFATRDLNRTLSGVELLYASLSCHGDVDVARTSLTFKASSALRGNRRFGFGFRLGIASVLLVWALWDCVMDDPAGKNVWSDPAFQIYRGLGNLVLLTYMWGVNVWVWRRFGIDYRRCLSLDPKGPRVDPCEQVWNVGCNLSVVFLASFILFYKLLRGLLGEDKTAWSHLPTLGLLLYMVYVFVIPWSERKGLLWVLWTVVISPFGTVRFLEGYVGDILTSVVRVLIDLAYALIFFCSLTEGGWLTYHSLESDHPTRDIKDTFLYTKVLVPFLTAAPLWWRFQQNLRRSYETRHRWPHLGNALKYATAMSVALFGTFQPEFHSSPVWIMCFVIATLYQYTWDIFMDWDLLRWDGWALRLRPRLLYRKSSIYWSVAVVNLALRFMWTITLMPENPLNSDGFFGRDLQVHVSPFIAAAEIIRRTMWGFLRVENEHLQIYGSTPDIGSGIGSEDAFVGFSAVPSSSVSTAVGSSIAGSASGSDSVGGWEPGAKAERHVGSINRGSGLDNLPYSRMDISSSGGLSRRVGNPLKAWCLNRVKPESRLRLLGELVFFTCLLSGIVTFAWLSSSLEDLRR